MQYEGQRLVGLSTRRGLERGTLRHDRRFKRRFGVSASTASRVHKGQGFQGIAINFASFL
eukprot:scaffold4084_cov131-Cylindrotheca_fusiformis.AAC.1